MPAVLMRPDCNVRPALIKLEFLNLFHLSNFLVMSKIVDWDSHIGRRLRLRDLHVFFTVVQSGSMAKAAEQLPRVPTSSVKGDCRSGAHGRCLSSRSRSARRRADDIRPRFAQSRAGGVRRVATGDQGYRVLRRSDSRRAEDWSARVDCSRDTSARSSSPSIDNIQGW